MRDFTGVSGADGGLAKSSPAPATRWPAEVANALVQEIANVVRDPDGGNAALDPGDNTQLLTSIQAMIAAAIGAPDSQTIQLGSRQIKFGRVTGSFSESSVPVVFTNPFPARTRTVVITSINNQLNSRDIWAQEGLATAFGFSCVLQYGGGQGNSSDGFNYIAIGE